MATSDALGHGPAHALDGAVRRHHQGLVVEPRQSIPFESKADMINAWFPGEVIIRSFFLCDKAWRDVAAHSGSDSCRKGPCAFLKLQALSRLSSVQTKLDAHTYDHRSQKEGLSHWGQI
ncbi:hypothetical protein JZ751_017988 [Albula glossodonta]|uniref:Uncharacterized protein n=1 Tax=Albula glossodonta TaxID=121402 RepID=A0A8T2PPX2_9TELE|nr:hypothetical protein JZ751_017988 [Albula glossodonta]